ncbi:MAG: hypothetical protein JST92_12290, partial [Deltaproteobacteria bacterium]|nr:hypothetical protein [Deltaproteobacteria bacterium]
AICGASGALVLADATHWPPTFGAPSNTFGIFGQVAFSADATRLVLTDVSRAPGRINTYELTGGTAAPRPLNSVIASGGDVPIDPITAPNGTFYVGGTGGWYVLSAQTGAVTAHPLVSAQFTAPHLQAVAVDGAPDTLAVVMLSRSSDTRISVDPYSIQQQGADLGHGADDVVTSADGTDTFWLTGGTLTRNRDAQATFTLAPGSFTGKPKLSLAPGGGAVFLRYQTAANPDREKVVVLGAQGNWTSAPAPLELGLPQKLVGVASDGQQRVALLGAAGGQVYDLTAALGSRTAVTIGDPLTPRFPQATYLGMASDGTKLTALYRLVSTSSDYRQTSWALDDATLLSDWALPPSAEPLDNTGLFDSVVAAPGGRRIYWLTGAPEQRRLLTLVLDPATGQVIGEENAISVPGGARDLLVYPDGESLLVLDAEQDTLLLYR